MTVSYFIEEAEEGRMVGFSGGGAFMLTCMKYLYSGRI